MTQTQQTPEYKFRLGMLEVQKANMAVEKDKDNPYHKNKFVSMDEINNRYLPLLNKFGFIVIHRPCLTDMGEQMVETTIQHVDGYGISSQFLAPRAGKTDQNVGASITYGKRYNIGSLLNIRVDVEDDGELDRVENEKEKEPAKSEKTSQSVGKITSDQVKELDSLIGDNVQMRKDLLQWKKIPAISDLQAGDYAKLVEMVKARLSKPKRVA